MRKLLLSIFLIIIVTSSVLAITYREASKQAKPTVLLIHEHGCSACQKLMPLYDEIASKYSNKFKFVKEDLDSSSWATKLNVKSVPAVFIINPKTQATEAINYDCLWQQGCFEKTLQNYNK